MTQTHEPGSITQFFESCLRAAGPLHIAGGLLLFATAFSSTAQSYLVALLQPPAAVEWSTFFVAVFGPTIASWGVLFTALTEQYLAAPTDRLWIIMLVSIGVWLPLDTALCVHYEFYMGAAINGIVAAFLLIALFGVRKKRSDNVGHGE